MTNEELVLLIQRGIDKKANIEKLYTQNLGLIGKIASSLSAYENMEDLKQEAYFGLIRAAELWDPEGGAAFSSYAALWIKQGMLRYIERCGSVIRLPANSRARITQYKRIVSSFQKRLNRLPTARELAAMMQIKVSQVDAVKADALLLTVSSLDLPLAEDNEIFTVGSTVADPDDCYEEVLDRVQNDQLAGILWQIVDDLGDLKSAVLRMRYQQNMTLKECAEELGLSYQRVHRIQSEAIRSMRRSKNVRQLMPYADDRAYQMGLSGTGLGTFRRTWTSATERAVLKLLEKEKEKLLR